MQNIKIAAYRFLLDCEIKQLPLTFADLERIAKDRNWLLLSYNEGQDIIRRYQKSMYAESKDGFAIIEDNMVIILYRDDMPTAQKLFVICHEFGHVTLKHSNCGVLGKSKEETTEIKQEREADKFAEYVTSPPCVLKKCKVQSHIDVEKLTLLDTHYAATAYETIYSEPKRAETPEERRLISRFRRYIFRQRCTPREIGFWAFAALAVSITIIFVVTLFAYGQRIY